MRTDFYLHIQLILVHKGALFWVGEGNFLQLTYFKHCNNLLVSADKISSKYKKIVTNLMGKFPDGCLELKKSSCGCILHIQNNHVVFTDSERSVICRIISCSHVFMY